MKKDPIGLLIIIVTVIIIFFSLFEERKSSETVCVDGIEYFTAYDRGKKYPGAAKINPETGEYQRCR